LAIYSDKFREAVWRLIHVWGNFHVNQVFRADLPGLLHSSAHWMAAILLGGLGKYSPSALLDRAPLVKLLDHYLPFEKIDDSIEKGLLHALSITASSYTSGYSIAFFQGKEELESWHRTRRMGVRDRINVSHLMASSAIPVVFKPEKIGHQYFGDGSIRQTAPLSPALHLGADRIMVIGVKHNAMSEEKPIALTQPTLGQVSGHVLDSIFLDNVDMDVERLARMNKMFSQIPDKHLPEDELGIRQIDILSISPSQDLYKIAEKHANLMPRTMRIFLRGLGVSRNRGSNLLSYLLFEKAYCRELIALGYGDALERRHEIADFFNLQHGEHHLGNSTKHDA
jgi:NTE family protein